MGILEQLLRGQQHHDDQSALGQVLRLVGGTVQPIPVTLLTVTALVTMVVTEVVGAVFVIFARLAAALALEVVEQALGCIAQLITLMVDVIPAGQRGGAVGPGVLHGERAVTPVPLAGVTVAVFVTDAIPRLVCTVLAQAGGRGAVGGARREFTVTAPERRGALAGIIRRLPLGGAAAAMLARAAGTSHLTVLRPGAETAWPQGGVHTLLAFLTLHVSTSTLAPCP